MQTREQSIQFFNAIASRRVHFVRKRRAYYDDLHAWLSFHLPHNASVVEIGCGIGNVLSRLPQQKKTGIDFSDAMIAQAQTYDHTGTRYILDDAEHLTHTEKYDIVLLLDTANSLWDVQRALEEIRGKLCHSRTKLFITYHNFLWKPLLLLAARLGLKSPLPPQNWLSPHDMKTFLNVAGFELIADGTRFLWPWNTPLIAPFFNRFLAQLPIFRLFSLVHYTIARPYPVPQPTAASVSIIVPARNEEGNIARILQEMPNLGSSTEIIFVEGHSQDQTWEVIKRVQSEYHGPLRILALQQEGKGKGDAVRMGFSHASNDILFILDSDLTVGTADLPKFYAAMASGVGEFLNGSRLVYPMENDAMRFLNLLGNKFFSMMFSWLLGQPIKDTLCGTKVLWRKDYERIAAGRSAFGSLDPFGDFDLLFGAARLYLRIIEIPVRYHARTYGETNIRRFRDGALLLRMCAKAALRLKFR